jgi:hypothetical protein
MRFGDSGGEPLASGCSVGGVVGSEEEVRTGAGSGLTWEAKEMLYAICRVVEFFWQNDDPDGRCVCARARSCVCVCEVFVVNVRMRMLSVGHVS